jgi:hypothetical protein
MGRRGACLAHYASIGVMAMIWLSRHRTASYSYSGRDSVRYSYSMARRRSQHRDGSTQQIGSLQRVFPPRPLIHLPSQISNADQCVDQDAVVQCKDPSRVRVPSYRTEYEYEYEYE